MVAEKRFAWSAVAAGMTSVEKRLNARPTPRAQRRVTRTSRCRSTASEARPGSTARGAAVTAAPRSRQPSAAPKKSSSAAESPPSGAASALATGRAAMMTLGCGACGVEAVVPVAWPFASCVFTRGRRTCRRRCAGLAFGATFAPDRELIGGGGGATYERTGAAGGGGGGGGGGRSGFGGVVGGGRSGDGTVVVPATAASERLVNGDAAAKPRDRKSTRL